MQLELFCAEDTVRRYTQRMTAHAEQEQITRLLTSAPGARLARRRDASKSLWSSRGESLARRVYLLWCTAVPRRWSPCPAPS